MTYKELVTYMDRPGLKVLENLNIKNIEEVYQRWVNYIYDYGDKATIYYNFDEVISKLDKKIKQGMPRPK